MKELQIKGELLRATLLEIADGKKKALRVLVDLLGYDLNTNNLQKLIDLNITGNQFLKVWKHSANQDLTKMRATIDIINRKYYSSFIAENNLTEEKPLPIIYEEVEINSMKYWDWKLKIELDNNSELEYEYCERQERAFWEAHSQKEEEHHQKELKKLTSFWRIRI